MEPRPRRRRRRGGRSPERWRRRSRPSRPRATFRRVGLAGAGGLPWLLLVVSRSRLGGVAAGVPVGGLPMLAPGGGGRGAAGVRGGGPPDKRAPPARRPATHQR